MHVCSVLTDPVELAADNKTGLLVEIKNVKTCHSLENHLRTWARRGREARHGLACLTVGFLWDGTATPSDWIPLAPI